MRVLKRVNTNCSRLVLCTGQYLGGMCNVSAHYIKLSNLIKQLQRKPRKKYWVSTEEASDFFLSYPSQLQRSFSLLFYNIIFFDAQSMFLFPFPWCFSTCERCVRWVIYVTTTDCLLAACLQTTAWNLVMAGWDHCCKCWANLKNVLLVLCL